MSYEGYRQNICESGHRFNSQEDYWSKSPNCPHCNKPVAWSNAVDQTNCYDEGYILDSDLTQITPEIQEKCNLGCFHITSQATYMIPSEEERKKMQTSIVGWNDRTPIREYYIKR